MVVQWGEDICKLGDNYPEAGTLLSSGEGGRETASDEDDLLPSTISGSAQWTLPVATHRCHSGWVAKLERSLLQYTLDSLGKDRSDGYCMNAQEGYQEVAVPNITNQSDLQFTGHICSSCTHMHIYWDVQCDRMCTSRTISPTPRGASSTIWTISSRRSTISGS